MYTYINKIYIYIHKHHKFFVDPRFPKAESQTSLKNRPGFPTNSKKTSTLRKKSGIISYPLAI